MQENIASFLSRSIERIKHIDDERRFVESVEGRVEPNIENMQLGEAKKFRLAVLHIDINDFKKITLQLNYNIEYLRFVSIFLTEMTHIVLELDGMIDRYVGDQVTALFGIDHDCTYCGPETALKCGLNMLTAIKYTLNKYLSSIGFPTISCSLGIDFGDVWIAKVGLKGNNQFTLIGNTVNIAAQLLELAPPGKLFIGQRLYDGIPANLKSFCDEEHANEWNWINPSDRSQYRFYLFPAMWEDYPI
jgi:adenylate cyclase